MGTDNKLVVFKELITYDVLDDQIIWGIRFKKLVQPQISLHLINLSDDLV